MNTTHTNSSSEAGRERFDVILPAGGRIEGAFAEQADTDIKALIRLGGQTILSRTIGALRATGRAGRIVVIGPQTALDEAQNAGVDVVCEEGASGPDNILRGLNLLQSQGRVLIVTTDLPFLTPDALNAFLDACPPDADVALPIMTRSEFETRFPGTQNEYVRLKEGQFTLGCAFVVNAQTLLQNEAHVRALFAARKSQWQMVRLIGLGTGLRFAMGRLSIAHLEERAGQIARCRGRAIPHMPPELAYDIDLPEEFDYAREHAAELNGPVSPDAAVSDGASPPSSFGPIDYTANRIQETAP